MAISAINTIMNTVLAMPLASNMNIPVTVVKEYRKYNLFPPPKLLKQEESQPPPRS